MILRPYIVYAEEKFARLDRSFQALTAFFLAAVIFISFNIFAALFFTDARLDLTDGKLHTLSENTHRTLERVEEPVTVRLFFSSLYGQKNPQMETYARRVQDLLERYVSLAPEMLSLEIEDPVPFSDAEDRALTFGLQGVPLPGAPTSVYFGVVATDAVGRKRLIPYLEPGRSRLLEYDLTRLFSGFVETDKTKIAISSYLPVGGNKGQAMISTRRLPRWKFVDQLDDLFDVRFIPRIFKKVPDDIDVLMLIQPHSLLDITQYALDQFVLRGGRLVVFMDPYAEVQKNVLGVSSIANGKMDRLLKAWGLAYDKRATLLDMELARKVTHEPSAGKFIEAPYPAWLVADAAHISNEDAVTANLERLIFGTPGSFALLPESEIDRRKMVWSSPQSMMAPIDNLRYNPTPDSLASIFKAAGKEHVLAVRIAGKLQSAYPDGAPMPVEGALPHLSQSEEEAHVVLVADTDFLHEGFWFSDGVSFADNGKFVVNLLENMSGANSLISLRGRGTWLRPFVLIESIRKEAEARYKARSEALEAALDDAQRSFNALQEKVRLKGQKTLSVTEKERLELLRKTILTKRRDVRRVQLALQEDVAAVERAFFLVNTLFVPLLLCIGALLVFYVSYRRRKAFLARFRHANRRGG